MSRVVRAERFYLHEQGFIYPFVVPPSSRRSSQPHEPVTAEREAAGGERGLQATDEHG